jgi:Asp-tRNA(Asn)/Glu-tRNA(Gln) amidotransferase A subunit family amidase
MSAKDLNYLSAIEVCSLYRSRELSPVELLESFIQRAEEIDETVNPFTDKYFSEARIRAKKSEERYIKGSARRLEGVPLLIKDSSSIKGIRATAGSLRNANKIDQHTDPSVERLMRAGANFFARSTCPEFCWLFACHSRMWGVTRNP